MTRRRITASASARAIACGYWLDEAVELPVEPSLVDVPDEELDDLERARREGDKLHAVLEADDGTSDDSSASRFNSRAGHSILKTELKK
jgi:hypothetical protein